MHQRGQSHVQSRPRSNAHHQSGGKLCHVRPGRLPGQILINGKMWLAMTTGSPARNFLHGLVHLNRISQLKAIILHINIKLYNLTLYWQNYYYFFFFGTQAKIGSFRLQYRLIVAALVRKFFYDPFFNWNQNFGCCPIGHTRQ